MKAFKPGQRVAFSRAFLKSTGQLTGDAPFMRGTVKSCQPIGRNFYCLIFWDDREKPSGALSSNLIELEKIHLETA